MLIQCTKKLLDELNLKPVLDVEEEPLFSWHANIITLSRKKTVVLVNDKNRYIVVLHGLKKNDFKKLDELIIKAIRESFLDECIKNDIIDEFIDHSKEIIYTKTKDKTSVARMNKSCEAVGYYEEPLCNESIVQCALCKKVNRFLVGNGKEYITPSEELFKDLEALSGKFIFSCRALVIKVKLDLENYNVWRRIVIPINVTFNNLHKILQATFGWKNYHLHEFYIYEKESDDNFHNDIFINHPSYIKEGYRPVVNLVDSEEAFECPKEIEMKLERNIKLSEYIPKYKRMKYNYDFGDNWQHIIEAEEIIEDYDKNYSICLEGEGNTPPEDVGGEGGYEEFLKIINDNSHPEHKSMLAWGEIQGYRNFDIEMVNRELKSGYRMSW